MMMKRLIFTLAAFLMLGSSAFAQLESPVKWSYAAKKISSTEAVVLVKATIEKGWHIYALDVKEGGPIKTSFTFPPSKDYSLVGKPSQPKPKVKFEKVFDMNVTYFENSVVFQQKIKLKSPRAIVVKGSLEFAVCDALKCLPPDNLNFSIPVSK